MKRKTKCFPKSLPLLLLIFVSVSVIFVNCSVPATAPSSAAENIPTMSGVYQDQANSKFRSTNDLKYLSSLGLHVDEYPNDDFSHILGATVSSDERKAYTPSKLQQICRLRLEDVANKKGKISHETKYCGTDVITVDQYMKLISEFDAKYGRPLNLQERIAVDAMVMLSSLSTVVLLQFD